MSGRMSERRQDFRPVAMSVLASGALNPREAIAYVASQPGIESIVFGASSRANILQTKSLIDEFDSEVANARARGPIIADDEGGKRA